MQTGKNPSEFGENRITKSPTDYMESGVRLAKEFYLKDVLEVAPELPGKDLVIKLPGGTPGKFRVTEVEAYRGSEDRACHAFRGRTARTEIMFHEGGRLYIYLIYGMYWMLNIVTAGKDIPQAVLVRGVENYPGPGMLTKGLGIDKSFYGEDLTLSDRIWLEDPGLSFKVKIGRRIGIDYAGEYWKSKPWRFFL